MHKVILLFLIPLMLFSFACTESSKKPTGILDNKKMVAVMWDMMKADEFVTLYLAKDTTRKQGEERIKRYKEIFELHKVSKEQFEKSYQYYINHPQAGKILLDSLTAHANRDRSDSYRYKPKAVTPH